ncbi:MAG TPA: rhodanese-like domain-containing protein [Candidatus Nitrosotalea sp.]|nr:rhodanese-like domain-containing protein [Candidatus Nitrosotalea sp.]
MAERRADLLSEARKTVPEVSAEQAKEQFDRGEVLIVDVRDRHEWEAGHIPGSISAPRGLIEWLVDPDYSNHIPELIHAQDKKIVVQCALGGRSLLAAQALQRLGFTAVSSMDGGITDWSAKGFPVAT